MDDLAATLQRIADRPLPTPVMTRVLQALAERDYLQQTLENERREIRERLGGAEHETTSQILDRHIDHHLQIDAILDQARLSRISMSEAVTRFAADLALIDALVSARFPLVPDQSVTPNP